VVVRKRVPQVQAPAKGVKVGRQVLQFEASAQTSQLTPQETVLPSGRTKYPLLGVRQMIGVGAAGV
jgi:hypothetical protein